MPELPEVETVCRGLNSAIAGKIISSLLFTRKNIRIPIPQGISDAAAGKKVVRVYRRAKYIIIELSGGISLIAHLGMSGQFLTLPKLSQTLQKHDHAVFLFNDESACVYRDPRRFGLITYTKTVSLHTHDLLKNIGPEPFSGEFSAKYLASELKKRKAPLKVALLDQSLVAGIGNIYASEVCFLTGIHPQTPANKAYRHSDALVKAIRKVLEKAILSGGSSLRDFVNVDGNSGYFQHSFDVYGRAGKPCNQCQEPILSCTIGGRSTFFCNVCQMEKL